VVGARLIVDVELGDDVDQQGWPHGRAEPPAGHGELLAECVEDDAALGHVRQRRQRPAGAGVAHVPVSLVAEHDQVVLQDELGDALQLLRRALRPGRVLQVVEQQQPRAPRDLSLERVEVELEVVAALQVAVGQALTAVELDLALVDRVAGVGIEDLVAGIHEGEDELADHRLAAGLNGDVLGAVLHAVRGADVGGERLAQRQDTGVGDRLHGGVDDVLRCGQVEVAEVEGVDGVSLLVPARGFRGDREGGLRAQPLHPLGKVAVASEGHGVVSSIAAGAATRADFVASTRRGDPPGCLTFLCLWVMSASLLERQWTERCRRHSVRCAPVCAWFRRSSDRALVACGYRRHFWCLVAPSAPAGSESLRILARPSAGRSWFAQRSTRRRRAAVLGSPCQIRDRPPACGRSPRWS